MKTYSFAVSVWLRDILDAPSQYQSDIHVDWVLAPSYAVAAASVLSEHRVTAADTVVVWQVGMVCSVPHAL